MFAHVRPSDRERQTLADHIRAVERLAGAALKPVGQIGRASCRERV